MIPPETGAPATITAMQHEFTPPFTTFVITLTAPVGYEVHRLAKPERVYIDFQNARLSPQLSEATAIVGKPCLRKYRLASHPGRVVRIAFETGTVCGYSAKVTGEPSTRLFLLLRPSPTTAGP